MQAKIAALAVSDGKNEEQTVVVNGVVFVLPVSVTRAGPPPKPQGFYWRSRRGGKEFELRRNVRNGDGERRQAYVGGMALSTWQRLYDRCTGDQERLAETAEWLQKKLAAKTTTTTTAQKKKRSEPN